MTSEPPPPVNGKVEVSETAIATLIGRVVTSSYGVVGMAPRRLSSGIVEVLPAYRYRRGVDVRRQPDGLVIDVYVVMEYGTRIGEVARNIIATVKFAVERAVGLSVVAVNVNVRDLRISRETKEAKHG